MAPRLTENEKEEKLIAIRKVLRALIIEAALRFSVKDYVGVRITAQIGKGLGSYRFGLVKLSHSNAAKNKIIENSMGCDADKRYWIAVGYLEANYSQAFNTMAENLSEEIFCNELTSDDKDWAIHTLEQIGIARGYSHYHFHFSFDTTVTFDRGAEANSEEEALEMLKRGFQYGISVNSVRPSIDDPKLKVLSVKRS